MRIILAALVAAFLAMPVASADRPVGPETGQARSEPQVSSPGGPDDGADALLPWWLSPGIMPHRENDERELRFMPSPDSCWFWWRCN